MAPRKPQIHDNVSFKTLSASTPKDSKRSSSSNWRAQVQQSNLVSQVSAILLQRQTKYWAPLVKTTLQVSKLTPSLFLQVLQKTQTFPQISLNFFNWAKKNLAFQPDLKSQCKLTRILYSSGLSRLAKPILDSLIEAYPSTQIVGSLCEFADFDVQSPVLCSVLKSYCSRGLFLQALDVYQKAKELGRVVIPVHGCNELLNLLQGKDEMRLAWCFYGSMIRNGVIENQSTWSIISRTLCKIGKFERIVRIMDMGIHSSLMYSLLIENYSKRGNFDAAFGYLAEICDRKLASNFTIYSSILDGACKYQDAKVIEMVLGSMQAKGYVPKCVSSLEYDSIIQKLSDLGKTYAAGFFLHRACNEKIELQDATYGCMLRALSNEDRMKDATRIYFFVLEKKMMVRDSCYSAFLKGLCKQTPSKEVCELLKDVIGKGFHPPVEEVSKYIKSVCHKSRWREAEELLNLIVDRGFLPDPSCYRSLIKHYCTNDRIDSAIMLHKKMEILDGTFDVNAYNVLLNEHFKQSRVEGAQVLFDYMRMHKMLGTGSFVIMIRGLCRVKDLRKAMKLHDEMLYLGLKPAKKSYKLLISGFG